MSLSVAAIWSIALPLPLGHLTSAARSGFRAIVALQSQRPADWPVVAPKVAQVGEDGPTT